jgi:succinyl-diaminopimelate desuccinylase
MTNDLTPKLNEWIDQERDEMIAFLKRFLQAKSPNPPGDTRDAAAVVTEFLDARNLPYRMVSPNPVMPNIIGSFDGAGQGKHLVLNGHIDVFPVDEEDQRWTTGPWEADIREGKIYGRGACDMKPGTTASIFTYAMLHRIRDEFGGKLTLTCVSDEETFGPWGARYLMDNEPEVLGDCLLNGEPSSPLTIRFGEKGPLWLAVTIQTEGAHGAYVHATESATKIAARLGLALESVCDMEVPLPDNLARAIEASRDAVDKAMGKGAHEAIPRVTLNIGSINGGLKVNIIPGQCRMEIDFRIPVGADKDMILKRVNEVLSDFPEATMEEIGDSPPAYSDPYGEMVTILQDTVEELRGFKPTPIISLGGTDARLWRYRNIPAYVYGPFPYGMGSYDEHVDLEDFVHVVRTHVLASYRYLSQNTRP